MARKTKSETDRDTNPETSTAGAGLPPSETEPGYYDHSGAFVPCPEWRDPADSAGGQGQKQEQEQEQEEKP